MFIKVKVTNGRLHADLARDRRIVGQLRREAGLGGAWPDPPDAYDRLLGAAGRHGIGLETEETTPEKTT